MTMRHLFLFIIILSIFPKDMYSQEINDTTISDTLRPVMMLSSSSAPSIPKITSETPPSPQAVAFNRLGDYQVNNNYGVPDINIPLFEIDFHGYKIPLTLHYEAMPMKSGYNYDVTGLGWTLSGNSCVSRTIKDRADEYGWFGNPFELDTYSINSQMTVDDWTDDLNKLNFQYDSYNIVLPSGRTIPFLMYKFNGAMQYDVMPNDRKVKISCSYSSNSIDAFTVDDENGITYNFTLADKAQNGFQNDFNAMRNVTWLLTSICIPAKGTIFYHYTDVVSIHTSLIEEPRIRVSRFSSQMLEDAQKSRFNVTRIHQQQSPRYDMRFLKSISYGPTKVEFNYMDQGTHMKDIVITDCNDTIRHFTLNISNSALASLIISGKDDVDRQVYSFDYCENRYNNNSTGIYTDFWGNLCNIDGRNKDLGNFNMYFNNLEDGNVSIDTVIISSQLRDNGYLARIIPNKESDPFYYYKVKLQSRLDGDTRIPTSPEQHGVLHTITYPNGGYTTFSFENNRFPTASAADGDIVFDRRHQRIIEGGGFRIKSIQNYTANGLLASEEHYRYGFTYGDIIQRNFPLPLIGEYNVNDHIGCGEAVVDPNLLTFMDFSYYASTSMACNEFRKMAVGQESLCRYFYNIQGSATWWDADFSANTFRSHLGGRRPVVYPEITVYHGNPDEQGSCIGKTVYKYDIYNYQHTPFTYYMSSLNQESVLDTAYFESLYYFNNAPRPVTWEYPSKRHQLKSVSNYSYNAGGGTWDLVAEESYKYNEDSMSKYGSTINSCTSWYNHSYYVYQLGDNWLEHYGLNDFYITLPNQFWGRSTISEKSTTVLRQGGTRTDDNTLTEKYSYLFPDVLKSREYTDVYDNKDIYRYVGEEVNSDTVISAMKSRNMLASVLSSATTACLYWPDTISGTKIEYAFFGNRILPSKFYERNGEVYQESVEALSYDSYGNPTEIVDYKTGIHSVYIWDTYGRYLTAMMIDATLSQVDSVYSQIASEDSRSRHTALQSLLPNAQIQTWDYIPLIGVSSHTDASGNTLLYEYDGLGRLKSEKRMVSGRPTPELIKEYEYNYLNQRL